MPVDHAAVLQPVKQQQAQSRASQAIIDPFKGWQKIGLRGEKLVVDAPSVDLSDMVANFDKEELTQDVDLPDDLSFDDVDISVSTDDVVAELDKEFSFLATTNENSTRLELARAYMEMGDRLGARDLLEEVVAEGSGEQKSEAQGILMRIG